MTHAALMQETEKGCSLAELAVLPFVLMLTLFCAFFGLKLDWLKQQRRTRPLPASWREHYDKLRLAEWSVIEVTAAGLAQLLAGKPLDLEGIAPVDPPAGWHCPCPRSAFEMHRRIEAVVAFNADPEGRIRRIAKRASRDPAAGFATDHGPMEQEKQTAVVAPPFFPPAVFVQRIRAPPWLALLPIPLPTLRRAAPRRTRSHACAKPRPHPPCLALASRSP